MALPAKRFHVSAFEDDVVSCLIVRCTVCGVRSVPFGESGDAVRLSDLDEWAEAHACPGLRVT